MKRLRFETEPWLELSGLLIPKRASIRALEGTHLGKLAGCNQLRIHDHVEAELRYREQVGMPQ